MLVTFVETALSTRLAREYWTDDEYAALQWSIATQPLAAPVIPGTGGVRKLRWKGSGRGKRGGLRVIYYARTAVGEIWMLTAYAKNVKDDIPAEVLTRIREEIDGDRETRHWR